MEEGLMTVKSTQICSMGEALGHTKKDLMLLSLVKKDCLVQGTGKASYLRTGSGPSLR